MSMEISPSLPILHCPMVAVHFQIGSQGQEAPAKTMTNLSQHRKYTLYMEIAERFSEVCGGPLRSRPLFRAVSHVLIKIMATQLELHLKLRGAGWTMDGLNHNKGHNPRLLSISKDPHRKVQCKIRCLDNYFLYQWLLWWAEISQKVSVHTKIPWQH